MNDRIFGWSYPPGCSGPPEDSECVYHNGMAYILNPKDDPPRVDFVESYKDATKYNTYWHVYQLEGAHEGPPVKIEVENARMEPGSYGGYYVDYDSIRWADDKTKFDGDLWDCYCDQVMLDLREILTV